MAPEQDDTHYSADARQDLVTSPSAEGWSPSEGVPTPLATNTNNMSHQGLNELKGGDEQGPPTAHLVAEHSLSPSMNHDYFALYIPRPTSAMSKIAGQPAPSTQSSSSSLPSLTERDGPMSPKVIRRIPSNYSDVSRGRRISHSKSSSTSWVPVKSPNSEHPVYPDQSFAALQYQLQRPGPVLRTRSSHSPTTFFTDFTPARPSRSRPALSQSAKTVGNTPISSPGLFSHHASRPTTSEMSGDDHSRSNSPLLHPAHTQKAKVTEMAEVERDLYTGNKIINDYEILEEIGRGEHGKVKLGRRMGEEWKVAIKIVPRYSKKRRLGKLGAPEDETKREVAILKKARHPNVVGLYEVIDDPSKNKVYLVLEFVENGEIKWRKEAPREILGINKARFEREKRGVVQDVQALDWEILAVQHARRRHDQLEERVRSGARTPVATWSLEHSADDDDETDSIDLSHSVSLQLSRSNVPSRVGSHDEFGQFPELSGSMYGPYEESSYIRERAGSLAFSEDAASHMSSEFNFEEKDEQFSYVPALTFEECRKICRDTLLGLEFLHSLGIIHRDIKPMNLLVGVKDVKISDFGVSYLGKAVGEDEEMKTAEAEAETLDDPKELARTVGTPGFFAPEMCYDPMDPKQSAIFEYQGRPKITKALDLWSLGITLYSMVYARLPFYDGLQTTLYESICKSEVFLPTTRLKAVDTSTAKFVSQSSHPINSNKRLDYDLEFEEIPETLRDLIRRLLVKDPVHRMTIEQAKRHPWVLEGLVDPAKWMENTNPEKKEKASIILAVDEKEKSHAIVKRSIVERAISGVKGLASSIIGRRDGRKRAISVATSTSASSESIASPSASSGSTVGKGEKSKEARRTSLRGDEILPALKASRESNGEHPLAQSQTASPVREALPSYFSDDPIKSSSTDAVPFTEDRRPRAPERAISSVSTTDSVKTIRAPQPMKRSSILETPEDHETSNLIEGVTTTLGSLATNARRLTGMRSRERRPLGRSPSPSRQSSGSDARAQPSLAISTASAHGDMETPDALRDDPIVEEHSASPAGEARYSHFQPPESSDAAFEHAQEMNRRRYIAERQAEVEEAAQMAKLTTPDDCPPSPDDIEYAHKINSAIHDSPRSPIPTLPSASTIASSEGFGQSSVSQSVSNPSIGVYSNASSPPNDTYLKGHHAPGETIPEFMRTADTITPHGHPVVATGKSLEEQEVYDDGDDEDDSSEDEGIVMGGPKKV